MLAMSPVTTTSESRREARLSRHRRVARRRLGVLGALLALVALVISGILSAIPAAAYWQSAGSGTGIVTTGGLAAPTGVTVRASSGTSVAVSWTASVGSSAPTGYFVTRTGGGSTGSTVPGSTVAGSTVPGSTVPACSSNATSLTTGTSCTDAAVPAGTYTYAVTAVYRSWTATSAISSSVTVATPAPTPNKLGFTSTPATTAAGSAISVAVSVQSSTGVTVRTANIQVTVALGANPVGGALSGTKTAITDATGVAVFPGLTLDKVGTGYTIVASSTGLGAQTSAAFAITAGAATAFAFTTPAVSGSASDAANLGPITVQTRDAFGNLATAPAGGIPLTVVSTSTGTVVLSAIAQGAATPVSIAAGASSATFYYGDTKAAPAIISVSSAGLPAISQTATITAATPSKLLITQQPTSTRVGVVLQPVTVIIADQFGNPTTSAATVSIAILNDPSLHERAALGGATSRNTVDGLVSYNDLIIRGNGNQAVRDGYTLELTSPGLTSATSSAFSLSR